MPAAATEAIRQLKALFDKQLFAVLSTQKDGVPYANIVAYAVTDDLLRLLFATRRDTRKYANLAADPRVALLIDSRGNSSADLENAIAVTITGNTREAEPADDQGLRTLLAERHPYMQDFLADPGCALFAVAIESLVLVSRFEQVLELHPSPEGFLTRIHATK